MLDVALFADDAEHNPLVEDLSQRFSIPVTAEPERFTWILKFDKDGLALMKTGHLRLKPLRVDLVGIRRKFKSLPIPRKGPLSRALGRQANSVIDATAGWGQDMMLAHLMGYDVHAVERSRVMGALLADGLQRYREYASAGRHPTVTVCDARSYLQDHTADCIYLDPMFPPKRKASALAKRPLRVLRELVGDDEDRGALFECARRSAAKRVVVKRPVYAKAMLAPDHTFSGKLMCYDVYIKTK